MIKNKDAFYDIVAPTSMGLRLMPDGRQPLESSRHFTLTSTSHESNILQIPASLGLKAHLLTMFVRNNPFATSIRRDLGFRGLSYEGPEVEAGGPWGHRHHINITDSGFGVRTPETLNDRAGEVGQRLRSEDFDLDDLFQKRGVKLIHLSGLFAALSKTTASMCLQLAERAREAGTIISFDLTYRDSFWKNRKTELQPLFQLIAERADILIGDEEDFQMTLDMKAPAHEMLSVNGEEPRAFYALLNDLSERYPGASVYATMLRQVKSASHHLWGGLLATRDQHYYEPLREIEVLDRVGSGSSFVGGLLYGILKGYDPEKWLALGWASGALAVTMLTDYAMPNSENQLWSIHSGDARFIR